MVTTIMSTGCRRANHVGAAAVDTIEEYTSRFVWRSRGGRVGA